MSASVAESLYLGCIPLLGLVLLVCAAIQLWALMSAFTERMSRAYPAGALVLFGISLLLLYCVGIAQWFAVEGWTGLGFAEVVLSMPLWAFSLAVVAIALATGVLALLVRRWRESHLTPSSVKEAFDLLPASMAFVDSEGVPVLVNVAMNQLSLEVLGRNAVDVEDLWASLQMKSDELLGKDEFVLRPAGGSVLLLRRESVAADDETFWQIGATDITSEHGLARELRAKNMQLQAMRRRIRDYGARVRDVARSQELLDARVMVHDEMGHVLLTTSYWLEHPEGYDASRLLAQWDGVLARMLEGAGERSEPGAEALAEVVEESVQLGVEVLVEGDLPADVRAQGIVLRALRESVANCARHAHGSKLWLRMEPAGEGRVRATLWNDGAVPTGPVQETGGLRSLRQAVERAGGTMRVQSSPIFQLELDLPA